MTDRELMQQALEALESATGYIHDQTSTGKEIAVAITALRERLAQPEQEPVAYIPADALEQIKPPRLILNNVPLYGYSGEGTVAVYTKPQPRREWVGLTEEEMIDLQDRCGISIHLADFQAIEAKLREKNA